VDRFEDGLAPALVAGYDFLLRHKRHPFR
jgi:hypothetical protein